MGHKQWRGFQVCKHPFSPRSFYTWDADASPKSAPARTRGRYASP